MRERRIDYFENSRRATYVHQQYAIANPARYDAYERKLVGAHRERRAWAGDLHDQWKKEALLRLQG